jgi:hypothetical protein
MKKLNKEKLAEKAKLYNELDEKHQHVVDLVDQSNQELTEKYEVLVKLADSHNEALTEFLHGLPEDLSWEGSIGPAPKVEVPEPLKESAQKISDAIAEYNTLVEDKKGNIDLAIEELNSAISEANGFAENIASEIQAYIDERSEKWQDSDRGSAYNDWCSAYQDLVLDEASLDDVTPIEYMPDVWQNLEDATADDLEEYDLPSEPESFYFDEIDIESFEALPEEPES